MDQITDAVLAAAGSPWVYPVLFLLTVLDAFFVVLPSETVVVALGALALSGHGPNLFVLIAVAAVAAVIGDSLTFALGRRVGLTRFRWMRRPQAVRAFAWARRSLDRRAAVVLLTARFVPFGRIAVNLTAGATGFDYRRFLGLTAIAGLCWAAYNAVIGAVFGAWFGGNPVLAVAVSIVVAVGLGILVDRVSARIARVRAKTPAGESLPDSG
ncbi:DedA family protein [Glaciihabitans sp. UYNi722]|uniref:DedA family protein n=1 Tax=Glaciihabitans sp. UYNi722 TaxID=3156344 RepID=UPI003397A746